MYLIETYFSNGMMHLWCSLYAGREGDKRGKERNGGERGARSPSRDTSAMCADETGRCAKPGFDRHLSSYQRVPEELQRPGPGVLGGLWLGINARITSASYHGLSRSVSCHETSYGRFSSRASEAEIHLIVSPSDTLANGHKMSSCFITFKPFSTLTIW